MNTSGRFIVLEGVDGCGSTTQTRRLVEALRNRGHDARATCEPSDGPIGVLIRKALEKRLTDGEGAPRRFDWATLALLFAADRVDHVANGIDPALQASAVVVSDRYTLSSVVYQSVTAPEGTPDAVRWISEINRAARSPDVTIVLGVSAQVAAERRRKRGGPEELFDAMSLQERLAQAYAKAEQLAPDQRIVHVSGEGSAEEVTERLLEVVRAFLPNP
ncbi:MAG TPA: dTMP kinase [Polyangiaceae bacterium]|nr:dTMP kinase [Polyangiaceae bacterium]